MNSIWYLQRHKFSSLSYEDKIKIKELGRPTPEIKFEVSGSSRSKSYKRHFHNSVYNNTTWICGCDVKNVLFCFPCVLFGGDKSWTVNGVSDLGHLSQSLKRHEATKKHLSNEVSLALLGNVNIHYQLDSAYWINVQRHNERVTKNRYVLSRIIDCIKFCGSFELALRGHDEGSDSNKPGVFGGLINFSAELDNAFREHLEVATTFNGTSTSKDIQNELLQCMLEVCRERIVAEIDEANYLAVIADETTDVASKYQISIVLRYVNEGSPVERFWGFINPQGHDADALAACIQSVIDPLLIKNPNKLIAQAYDGAVVMSGEHKGVQTIIKEKYPLANFVHCYAHQLNLIMSQAVSQNIQVRVFFSNVDNVVNFFSNSPQRINVLNEVAGRREPPAIQTLWNFKSQPVNVIHEHRLSLIECMQKIQEQFSNSIVINQASAIERLLNDEVFLFWLSIFRHILPEVNILYDQLQKRAADSNHIRNAIETFETSINNFKQNLDKIIENEGLIKNDPEPPSKRIRTTPKENLRASLEVCDVIISAAKDRFEFDGHLVIAQLLSSELFKKFSKPFPENILRTVETIYGDMFEIDRLKSELSVIYARPDFQDIKGAVSFLNMLVSNNLERTFKETVKLLELIITIPMTTVEAERCFSTLKRVKNFLHNSIGDDRLSALSMLSIENDLPKKEQDFNNKVIEKFANAENRRPELIYKK